jgi:hypothetical protein
MGLARTQAIDELTLGQASRPGRVSQHVESQQSPDLIRCPPTFASSLVRGGWPQIYDEFGPSIAGYPVVSNNRIAGSTQV